LVRKLAADYIEHAVTSGAHVIKEYDDSAEPDSLVDAAIYMARDFAAGDRDEKMLAEYHEAAERMLRELRRHDHDRATRMIVAAVEMATRPDREIEAGGLLGAIGVMCSDALDEAAVRDGKYTLGAPPRNKESEWQQEHGKKDWEEYAKLWAGEYEDHIEGHAEATKEPAIIDGGTF
jgi:hypothetical protein